MGFVFYHLHRKFPKRDVVRRSIKINRFSSCFERKCSHLSNICNIKYIYFSWCRLFTQGKPDHGFVKPVKISNIYSHPSTTTYGPATATLEFWNSPAWLLKPLPPRSQSCQSLPPPRPPQSVGLAWHNKRTFRLSVRSFHVKTKTIYAILTSGVSKCTLPLYDDPPPLPCVHHDQNHHPTIEISNTSTTTTSSTSTIANYIYHIQHRKNYVKMMSLRHSTCLPTAMRWDLSDMHPIPFNRLKVMQLIYYPHL